MSQTTKQYTLAKRRLEGESKYNYCPYCLKYFKEKNKDPNATYQNTLQKIIYNKTLEVTYHDNGDIQKYVNEFWYCDKCKRKLDTDDFVKAYCVRADGTRYTQPPLTEEQEKIGLGVN